MQYLAIGDVYGFMWSKDCFLARHGVQDFFGVASLPGALVMGGFDFRTLA